MKVLYVSHADKDTGYGIAARATIVALNEFVWITQWHIDTALPPPEGISALDEADVAIVHAPPWTAIITTRFLKSMRADIRVVIYTTWEAISVPMRVEHDLAIADEIWVPSAVTARPFHNTRVKVLPHARSSKEACVRGFTNPGVYSFSWWGAWTERKNPLGVLRAYVLAFEPDDNVKLLMHSTDITHEVAVRALSAIGIAQNDLPPISWSNTWRPLHEITGDCFVTASRGESWNLPAFEAMSAGAHVISTGGIGSDDFLEDTNAWLVDSALAPVLQDVHHIEGGRAAIQGIQMMDGRCLWRDPSITFLAEAMRNAADLGTHGTMTYDPDSRYDYPVVGKTALALLEQLQG